MTLVFGWFYTAASIRRLRDRNKSGWWIVPLVAATGLHGQIGDRLDGSWAAFPVGLAVSIGFIWGIVETYFMKGTRGPNRFGADPLEQVESLARGAVRWDQQGELEFVPHSAGPPPGDHAMRAHD